MFGAIDLGGAAQRLLPERIPLRFFGTAAVFHVGAWLGLVVAADDVTGFTGGPGLVLASLHALTLGVLMVTAMGAALQMLPVALGREAPSETVCHVAFALVVPGTLLMIGGFASYETLAIQIGSALVAVAAAVFVVTVARIIVGTTEARVVVLFVWAALASLALTAALGLALALNYGFGFVSDPASIALVHALLASYGFMGLLALGLSQIVIPIFAVTLVPYERRSLVSLILAVAALALGVVGVLLDLDVLVGIGIAAGLGAAGLHLRLMADLLGKRMRKRLSPEFILIRASWVLMPLPLVIGAALLLGALSDSGAGLFGFALLFGWLLTLLTGVLQRIVPMLASMYTGRDGRPPATPGRLTPERPLQIHRWCHLTALVVVGAGMAAELPMAIRTGALVGALGAAAFGAFILMTCRRMRDHMAGLEASAEAGPSQGIENT